MGLSMGEVWICCVGCLEKLFFFVLGIGNLEGLRQHASLVSSFRTSTVGI